MPRSADRAAALLLLAAALELVALVGCDDETGSSTGGSGGGGPAGSVGSSVAAVGSSSSTTGGGGAPTCRDLVRFGPRCDACLIESCCAQVELWGGIGDPTLDLDVLGCAKGNCGEVCFGLAGTPVGTPDCGPLPMPAPSGGACIARGGSIECDPITNEGCDAALGEACDATDAGGFACFPGPNDTPVCDQCSNANGPFCAAGSTCVGEGGVVCASFCCEDGDCGAGICFDGGSKPVFPAAPALGVCVAVGAGGGGGGGGLGGGGGAGGAGGN